MLLRRPQMPEDDIHQPHDKFFRAAFSNPETAAAFLQAYLDPELVALVDWGSLHVEPGSFIDAQMKATEADLLLSAIVPENPRPVPEPALFPPLSFPCVAAGDKGECPLPHPKKLHTF